MVVPVGFGPPSPALDFAERSRERTPLDEAREAQRARERERAGEAAAQRQVEDMSATRIGGGLTAPVSVENLVAIQEQADGRLREGRVEERGVRETVSFERFQLLEGGEAARDATEATRRLREGERTQETAAQESEARNRSVEENAAASDPRVNFAQAAAAAVAQGQAAGPLPMGAPAEPETPGPGQPRRAVNVSSNDFRP